MRSQDVSVFMTFVKRILMMVLVYGNFHSLGSHKQRIIVALGDKPGKSFIKMEVAALFLTILQ